MGNNQYYTGGSDNDEEVPVPVEEPTPVTDVVADTEGVIVTDDTEGD